MPSLSLIEKNIQRTAVIVCYLVSPSQTLPLIGPGPLFPSPPLRAHTEQKHMGVEGLWQVVLAESLTNGTQAFLLASCVCLFI